MRSDLQPDAVRRIHQAAGIGLWIGAAASSVFALGFIGRQPPEFQGRMLLGATILVAVEVVLGFFFFYGKFLKSEKPPRAAEISSEK